MKREESFNIQEYKSVHEYLDALFKHSNPSKKEIIDAKQKYRKLYLKNYLKNYSENNIQITFRVTKEQYNLLALKAKKNNIKPSILVKQKVLNASNTNNIELKTAILEVIDDIEEAIYLQRKVDAKIILKKMNKIEGKL